MATNSKETPLMYTVLNSAAAPTAFAIRRTGDGGIPAAFVGANAAVAGTGAAQTQVRLTSALTEAR